jgi:hypothetical protein
MHYQCSVGTWYISATKYSIALLCRVLLRHFRPTEGQRGRPVLERPFSRTVEEAGKGSCDRFPRAPICSCRDRNVLVFFSLHLVGTWNLADFSLLSETHLDHGERAFCLQNELLMSFLDAEFCCQEDTGRRRKYSEPKQQVRWRW